jgi:hypothetical protein
MADWKRENQPDEQTWAAIKALALEIEQDPFAVRSEGIPGGAPVNTRCAFVPGTNIVLSWLITIRQCLVTILRIEDAGNLEA